MITTFHRMTLATLILFGIAACGDHPTTRLTSNHWLVEDIDNRGIIDSSHLTLIFDNNGQLSGSAGCNHYQTHYTPHHDGFSIDPHIATTMKACAPALNYQETRFLDILAASQRFHIDTHGRLILTTDAGATITATALDNNDK